jgi:hypothetical protein
MIYHNLPRKYSDHSVASVTAATCCLSSTSSTASATYTAFATITRCSSSEGTAATSTGLYKRGVDKINTGTTVNKCSSATTTTSRDCTND